MRDTCPSPASLPTFNRRPTPSLPCLHPAQIVAVCVVVPLVLLAAMATALCWWRRRHDWLAGQQKRSGNDIEARVGEAGLTSGASVGVEGGSGAAVRQPYGVAGQGGCVFLGTGEGQGSTEWTHEDELEEEQEEEEKEAVDSKQVGIWVC